MATYGTRSPPAPFLLVATAVVMLTLATVPRIADCCGQIPPFENVTRNDTAISIAWTKPDGAINQTVMLNDTKEAANSWTAPVLVDGSTFTFAGLVPGRNYLLSLFVDCNFNTSSINGTYQTLPPTVNVAIIPINSTAMNVSWAPTFPADVDSYTVYLNETNNATAVNSSDLSSNIATQVFTGLVPGRSYQASVTAHSGSYSQPSANFTARTFPPTVNVAIIPINSTAMNVSWAPTIPADVDNYTVYLNETNNPTAVNSSVVSSNIATQVFTDLVPGRSYQASVTAHSGSYSQPSANFTARTLIPSVNVTISPINSTAMNVSWETNLLAVDVDNYTVYLTESKNATAVQSSNFPSTITTKEFTGLVPGRLYQASVTMHSGIDIQSSANVRERTLPPTVNVTIIINNSTSMNLSWVPFIAGDVDNYTVYLYDTKNATAVISYNLTSNTTQVFTDLVPGRSYNASVTAHSGSYSQPSANFTARTLIPSVNVTISPINSTAMNVSWETNLLAVDVDKYTVYLTESKNATAVQSSNFPSTITTKEFTGLVPGRLYQASVTMHSGIDIQSSANVRERTLPPTVNVTIIINNSTSMNLSWVPFIAGDVDNYTVYLYDTKNATAVISYNLTSNTTQVFTDLVPGRSYNASVTAHSGSYSQPSANFTARTFPPTVNVAIIPINSTAMNVSWAPTFPADVDSYTVYLNETNNATAVNSSDLSSNIATQVFTGLVPGRSYQASVTAHSGSYSQPSANFTARTFPPTVNVAIIPINSTAMNVSWAPTIPADVDNYTVYLNETNNPTAVNSSVVSSNIATQVFTDLVPGRSYQASVTAHSGSYSQPSANFTARTLPPTVNVTITPINSTAMNVSWAPTIPADVDNYTVYLNETNNPTAVNSSVVSSNIATQVFTDLVPGRSYQASVTAHSGSYSQPSANFTARTLPPKVNVTISASNSTSMNVSWAPNITVDVDYYMVYFSETYDVKVKGYNLPSTDTTKVFIDLVPGRSYQASVTAHSGNGSQASAYVTARTCTYMQRSSVCNRLDFCKQVLKIDMFNNSLNTSSIIDIKELNTSLIINIQ
ncbi:receptor-type tyrosine-protein phosphatase beta-like [Lampetra planeri]